MSMKKAKTTKASEPEDDVDRISSLPDPILDIILSSLPSTEEVIRTSILSKRWRYLWTSVPSLDIDCSRGLKEFNTDEFKEFVYWVLLNKSHDLDSFRLSCSSYYNMSTIGRWIHAAVMRNVKQIELIFSPIGYRNAMKLPHCLVTCDSLEVLRLSLSRQSFTLRNFTGFSSLRVLELNGAELMYLDHDSSKCLEVDFLKKFHLLEVLSLIDCLLVHIEVLCISSQKLKTLRLDNRNLVDFKYPDIAELNVVCPQLVDLEYGGYIAFYLKFDIKSLKKAVIYPIDMYQEETSVEDLSHSMYNLFSGVSHVESLSINDYFTECIKAEEDYPASFPHLFPNLKTLEIRTKFDAVAMNVLIHILKRSPNLESLHLIIEEGLSTQEFQTLVEELDEVETKRILTGHLKKVEFPEFSGEKKKLVIARFLLEHGNVLEEMVFICHKKVKNHKKMMKIVQEVSKSFKASSSVKLITLFKDQ